MIQMCLCQVDIAANTCGSSSEAVISEEWEPPYTIVSRVEKKITFLSPNIL